MRVRRHVFIKTALCLAMTLGITATPCLAAVPYDTYTYLYDGSRAETPHAYVTQQVITAEDLGLESLNQPRDLFVDQEGAVYISDTGNNRLVVLKPDLTLKGIIEGFERDGQPDTFQAPRGLYVTDKGEIYVADSGNGRIVVLDQDGAFLRQIGRPETDLISSDKTYTPVAVAVGKFDRTFVVAEGINLGVLEFNDLGQFDGFSGAQRVTYNPLDYLWRQFMTEEQLERTESYVPTEYSNIVTDEKGFYYVVSNKVDTDELEAAINGRSKDSKGAPVKRYNHSGFDVLKRNGYYPPAGDIYPTWDDNGEKLYSSLVDVALGEAGTYSVLDYTKNRIFTYSDNGDLLFAFSGKSSQVGNAEAAVALDYQGSNLLVLDSLLERITVYERTAYGDSIIEALQLYAEYRFEDSIDVWRDLLRQNPNFDLAYDGIGRAYINQENYKAAMECFALSNNNDMYSEALKGYRDQIMSQYMFLIVLAVVVLVLLLVKLFSLIGRANREGWKKARHPLGYHLLYAFHILFHPFDGFWDLKHEKRGGTAAATILLALTFLASMMQKVMTARIFNTTYLEGFQIGMELVQTVGVALLFVVANWCLTTLMDGEGSFRDIYVTVGYATLPLILTRLLVIPLSYCMTLDDQMYITFILSLGTIWMVFLIFCGITTVHQYTALKSLFTCLLSAAGMAVITTILLLFITTLGKILEFFSVLIMEFTR